MPILFLLEAFEHFRVTTRHVVWLMVAAAVVIAVSWTVYVAMRIRVTYISQHQIVQLTNDFDAWREASLVYREDMARRLNELERYVYGGPLPVASPGPQAPRPSRPSVQQWQLNRDAELRKRIEALEAWRHGRGDGR